jgi:hypothetical protein
MSNILDVALTVDVYHILVLGVSRRPSADLNRATSALERSILSLLTRSRPALCSHLFMKYC